MLKMTKFIITHGTDTMIETAQFLSDIKNKTIVLTGAMKPERFYNSDASINLGVGHRCLKCSDLMVFLLLCMEL